MIKVITTILILYLLYKLVFDFIVPVAKTTSQVKKQFNQMRNMQEENLRSQQQQSQPVKTRPKNSGPSTSTTDSEYIDFEDVK